MRLSLWAALLALAASALPAAAGPYVGFDGTLGLINWRGASSVAYPSDNFGAGLHFGDRISDHLGAELAYNWAYGQVVAKNPQSGIRSISNRLTVRDAALDGFGYLPLGPTGWFQPFLTAGLVYSQVNGRTATVHIVSNSADTTSYVPFLVDRQLTWRVGFGMEMRPSQDMSLRFTVRYHHYSFGSAMTGGVTFGGALNLAL